MKGASRLHAEASCLHLPAGQQLLADQLRQLHRSRIDCSATRLQRRKQILRIFNNYSAIGETDICFELFCRCSPVLLLLLRHHHLHRDMLGLICHSFPKNTNQKNQKAHEKLAALKQAQGPGPSIYTLHDIRLKFMCLDV